VKEVMTALVGVRSSELGHAHVTRVQGADQPPDGTTLAGGIPSLKQDAQRWTKLGASDQARQLESQRQQPVLSRLDPALTFGRAQLQPEVGIALGGHGEILSGPTG
jgi:hypothetical protein